MQTCKADKLARQEIVEAGDGGKDKGKGENGEDDTGKYTRGKDGKGKGRKGKDTNNDWCKDR